MKVDLLVVLTKLKNILDYQMVKLTDTEFIRLDENQTVINSLSYTYTKTGPATGTITTVDELYSFTTYNMDFEGPSFGSGQWAEEYSAGGNFSFGLEEAADEFRE